MTWTHRHTDTPAGNLIRHRHAAFWGSNQLNLTMNLTPGNGNPNFEPKMGCWKRGNAGSGNPNPGIHCRKPATVAKANANGA